MEYNRIQNSSPYSLHQLDQNAPRHSWVDVGSVQAAAASYIRNNHSSGDLHSMDVDSASSSPGVQRHALATELTFDAMKRTLAEPTEAVKRERTEQQQQLVKTFRNADFDDLVRRTEPKHEVIQSRLNDLFNSLAIERQIIGQSEQMKAPQPTKTIYENNFPELFFY